LPDAARAPLVLAEPFAVRAVLRRSAPRILRDGIGPIVAFFIGWKLIGLVAGIGFATAFAIVMYRRERRLGRPALVVRVALGLVLVRATVGLISGDAKVYLGQEVAIDALIGLTVLGSVVIGRPLGQAFAREVYPFPEALRGSDTFVRAFRTVTLVWALYFLLRSAIRLTALLTLSVDGYLLVDALSGAPFLVALLGWSILHTARTFRRSAEWGEQIVIAEAAAAELQADAASRLSP
jgi:intracellular septation protein A